MPVTSSNSWKRLLILGTTIICSLSIVLLTSPGQSITSFQTDKPVRKARQQSNNETRPSIRSNDVASLQDSEFLRSDEAQEKRLTQDIEKSIKRYELVKLDAAEIAAQVHRTGKLSFQTRSQRYDLNLVPHDMRASNYRAEEVGINGKLHAVKSGPIRTFKGTVRGMEGAQARFTVSDKRIEGLILKRNALYFMEPARKYSSSAGSSDYILYDSLDVEEPSELGCGVTLSQAVSDRVESIESEVALPKHNQSLAASTFSMVELATEADYEYVTTVGGSAQANDEILSIMNQVDGIFNTDLAIGFTIVYQHTWAAPNDPYTSISASGTLSEFTNYWNANMGGVPRDLAHMFTSRSMNDFIGFAWIGVVCNSPSSSYALSLRRTYRQATLVAHEIGHNFGATHIDNTSSCEISIMQSGVGPPSTFCEFSRNQIGSHVANHSGCLSSTPSNCDYVLSATGQTFTKDAGGGTVNVTAGNGCNWLATSNVSWISIVGAGNPDSPGYFNGNGSASIDYTVQQNSGYTRRGTISIAGQDFTVTQAGTLPDCIVTPIGLGQTVNGTLSSTDCASSWRFYFAYADVYSFNGVAGQQIRLSMNSPTFVPYLYLTGPNGALVASSNNNGGPNNAYIPSATSELTLATTGLYTIEATSWASDVTGAFTLDLVSRPAVVTAAASNVSTNGAQLNGNVNANGSTTNAWFEWGTTSSLSTFNLTPLQSVGSANTNVALSANLSGLTSDIVYYYRLVAANATGVTRGSILSFVTASNNIQVTVQTSPSNRSFTVDQTTYTSTQTFTWAAGSSHTISTTSLQSGATGTQYVWSNWSDGAAISHTVSPVTNTTITATFATQYFLTMSGGTCGSVSPSSNWYNSGQLVPISATPNSGCAFTGWTGSGSGSYTGADNPAAVTMNGPITETAIFSQNPPTATTGAASVITLSSATLNGNINPNNSATSAWFEWGTSANLSSFNITSSQSLGSGNANMPLSVILNSLSGITTYYFRVAASNSGGTTKGTIQSFTTIPTPILLTEENSNRAIALDSVTLLRDPFSITTVNNFSLDGRTRIMLFAANAELLSGENASVVTAQAEDSQQKIFPLIVEYVGQVPALDLLTQINVKLPDALANAGDVWLSISLRGQPSNKVLVRIRPSQ